MAHGFLDIAGTPSVKAAQAANGVVARSTTGEADTEHARFTAAEAQFIAARDNFYLASVSETGWPYVQHRGGPPGFLRVIDDSTLAFADFRGNRQYISLGNITANDRVAPPAENLCADRSQGLKRRTAARGGVGTAGLPSQARTPVCAASRGVRLELPATHNTTLHRTRDCRSACAGPDTHRAA
jgi:uncharacterized protein